MAKTKNTEPLPLTINIPGGKATFYSREEVTPRRQRELEIVYAQLNPRKIKQVQLAQRVLAEDGGISDDSAILDGPDVTLTEQEARLLYGAAEVAAWAYLRSWTLKESVIQGETTVSSPRPLPATPDDFLDLPQAVYKALTDHSAKIVARDIDDDDFEPSRAGVENPDSPTTA